MPVLLELIMYLITMHLSGWNLGNEYCVQSYSLSKSCCKASASYIELLLVSPLDYSK